MQNNTAHKFEFEVGVYRPPSEGGSYSLLLRVTRNCPWNKCAFCGMYKGHKFQLRSPEAVKQDIDAVATIHDTLAEISKELGLKGKIDRQAAITMLERFPQLEYEHNFVMVYNWILAGGRTAFLQDANSLFMKTEKLLEILQHLRKTLPSLKRVTSYARSRTLARKGAEELAQIRRAGLDRLHVGLETGDDTLLKLINKGVTSAEHIRGGRNAMAAGFELSEYWMPGLGGEALWEDHARNTARILNAINPDYIRSRPFRLTPGASLYGSEGFKMLTPRAQLVELKLFIEKLNVTSKVCFDHAGNYWHDPNGSLLFSHDYEGYQFPDKKEWLLQRIAEGIAAASDRPEKVHLRFTL